MRLRSPIVPALQTRMIDEKGRTVKRHNRASNFAPNHWISKPSRLRYILTEGDTEDFIIQGIDSLRQFFQTAPRRLRSWAVEEVKADFNGFGKT